MSCVTIVMSIFMVKSVSSEIPYYLLTISLLFWLYKSLWVMPEKYTNLVNHKPTKMWYADVSDRYSVQCMLEKSSKMKNAFRETLHVSFITKLKSAGGLFQSQSITSCFVVNLFGWVDVRWGECFVRTANEFKINERIKSVITFSEEFDGAPIWWSWFYLIGAECVHKSSLWVL